MSSSFWQKLPKPFVGLAPMDGVTDYPFRSMAAKYGRPDLIYTEFVSAEGLCHSATPLLKALLYSEAERPIVAQLFGKTPASFRSAAILLCELGFDGIDINMGCPAKTVAQHGCGAALIRSPELAQEIIRQTKQGVLDYVQGKRTADCPEFQTHFLAEINRLKQLGLLPRISPSPSVLPVSVKTRVGFDQPVVDSWMPALLAAEPAAIALHGRTLRQQYSGAANWELIGQAAALAHQTQTLIIGNGDVTDRTDALAKASQYQLDGVLIGRAALGNPFVLAADYTQLPNKSTDQLSSLALEHAKLYEQSFQNLPKYSFLPMRKHLGWYVKNAPHAKQIRAELVKTNSRGDVKTVLDKYSLV